MLVGLVLLVDYLKRAYLPEPARQRTVLIRAIGLSVILGKVRPLRVTRPRAIYRFLIIPQERER